MRIALVVTGGVDKSAREGVIPSLLWLIERLARRHDVHIYVLRYLEHPRSYPLLGAMVHDLGRPAGIGAQRRALVRALRLDGPFDILHAYWALPAGLVAMLAARRLRIPGVVTMDSGEFAAISDIDYGLQLRWRHRMAVAVTRRLASQITVCTHYQERLARRHGTRALVIPLGVDRRTFTPAAKSEGPPWQLIHVGNLNPVKDQRMLLASVRRLVARVPSLRLDIVGQDTLDGSIQNYAGQLGLDDYVTFHGFVPTDELVRLYQRAHLALLTSRHEAAGVVVLEAAACGVTTVGTAVGYIADWAPSAAVSVPNDAEALADTVAELLADRPARERIAGKAREWTLEHDADWTAEQFEAVYRDLVTGT